ncbi:MAG: nuclear transport factor 2 family protein [Alphaproteobacteria bacterium]|nr:MAG: nuclear transport factor 2 family protein [Alphaproteobacteria bacterium]
MIDFFVITAVQRWIAGDKHDKVAHLTFRDLLTAFAAAVEANDGEGLALLFTEDGTYEDGFFGAHTGRPAIAAMLQRFHDTGRDYFWEFLDPVSDGSIGYARFRFSYASRLPESAGRLVFFESISCFQFRDGLIAHYREAFDRGLALVQLDFPAERIKRVLQRAAAAQNGVPDAPRHLDRFSAG